MPGASNEPSAALVCEAVAAGFEAALDERLVGLVAYGSGADGSFVPGFSDLDVCCFLHGRPSLVDAARLHRRLTGTDLGPFEYLQVRYVDVGAPARSELVPGSVRPLRGAVDVSPYLHDDASLAATAAEFLASLPATVADDVATWSVATAPAHRRRHLRLIATRVKPAVRATLATSGTAPCSAYAADWPTMAERLTALDTGVGHRLAAFRGELPPVDQGAVVRAAELGLSVLTDLVHGG
jgi:hypothetical protein